MNFLNKKTKLLIINITKLKKFYSLEPIQYLTSFSITKSLDNNNFCLSHNKNSKFIKMNHEITAEYSTKQSNNDNNAQSNDNTNIKRFIGAQNTFYFEESKLTSSIDKSSPLYSKLYNNIPVVLILGWAGARDQNIQKYKNIYSELGYHTIRFSPSNNLTFIQYDKHHEYGYRLLNLLKNEYKLTSNPILTHMFSNASCFIVYNHVLNEINQKTPSKEYDFFRVNHQGAIFDSAPGWPPGPLDLLKGIAELNKSQIPNALMRYMVSSALVTLAVGFHYAHLKDHYFSRFYTTWVNDPRLVPTLILYSKVDKLISGENIQQQADDRKKKHPNLYLKTVSYPDAEHVMIYQKYPEDYLKHLKEHVELCKLDMKTIMKNLNYSDYDKFLVNSNTKSKL